MEDLSSSTSRFSLSRLLCHETFLNAGEVIINHSDYIYSTPKSRLSHFNYQEADNLFGTKHINEDILSVVRTSIPPSYYTTVSEDDEYVRTLIAREISHGFGSPRSSNNVIQSRSDEITWILQRSQYLRFRVETAYLSVTYLDRFLSSQSVNCEDHGAPIRLLSVACLCLAAKMEETGDKKTWSEFSVGEYEFSETLIQKTEGWLLKTLGWKMILATPFHYLDYFAARFRYGTPPPMDIQYSRSTEFIFDIMREIDLMEYRPSVIAMAAALLALDPTLSRQTLEFKINMFSSNGIPEIESVFYFYNRMRQLEIQKMSNGRM